MHVLTWLHKPSEEAVLASPSPGLTLPQYLRGRHCVPVIYVNVPHEVDPGYPGLALILDVSLASAGGHSCLTSLHNFRNFMKVCFLAAAR